MSALADFAHKFGSESRELRIGQSFFNDSDSCFHTIRCKYKQFQTIFLPCGRCFRLSHCLSTFRGMRVCASTSLSGRQTSANLPLLAGQLHLTSAHFSSSDQLYLYQRLHETFSTPPVNDGWRHEQVLLSVTMKKANLCSKINLSLFQLLLHKQC